MVGTDREDESGRHKSLKKNSKSEEHAAHVLTIVNASLTLKVSAHTSTCSYLF